MWIIIGVILGLAWAVLMPALIVASIIDDGNEDYLRTLNEARRQRITEVHAVPQGEKADLYVRIYDN